MLKLSCILSVGTPSSWLLCAFGSIFLCLGLISFLNVFFFLIEGKFFFPFFWLGRAVCGILSSLTKDQTPAFGSQSAESQPLDRQGVPWSTPLPSSQPSL